MRRISQRSFTEVAIIASAGLQRVMVPQRHRRGRVVAVEQREPTGRAEHAEGFGERPFRLRHMAQRGVEDHDVEFGGVEGQCAPVRLLKGDVGEPARQLARPFQQRGRRVDPDDGLDLRKAGQPAGENARAAADLEDSRARRESDRAEERRPHRLLLRIASTGLENIAKPLLDAAVQFRDGGPYVGHRHLQGIAWPPAHGS
jgi:hypothetical protein